MSYFFNLPTVFTFFSYDEALLIALSVILALVIYFVFIKSPNVNNYQGLAKKIFDFFTFKSFCFKEILKLIFLLLFSYNVVYGALTLFVNPIHGLSTLILNNIILRLVFEFFIMIFDIKENTSNISKCFYPIDDDACFEEDEIIEDNKEEIIVEENIEDNNNEKLKEKEKKETKKDK